MNLIKVFNKGTQIELTLMCLLSLRYFFTCAKLFGAKFCPTDGCWLLNHDIVFSDLSHTYHYSYVQRVIQLTNCGKTRWGLMKIDENSILSVHFFSFDEKFLWMSRKLNYFFLVWFYGETYVVVSLILALTDNLD